jgi:acyl-coenzyme A synthetase/AMP-(fatty) acid ligase
VRARLRSSKTPEIIEIWSKLPRTDTGKLLRREVVARLTEPDPTQGRSELSPKVNGD